MAERDDRALWRGARHEAAQESRGRAQAGDGRRAPRARTVRRRRRILARSQQLYVANHQRAAVRSSHRFLGARSGRTVLRLVGINSQAPHPQAALLAANFLLSREAQELLTKRGRMPTRPDVPVNPAYVSER